MLVPSGAGTVALFNVDLGASNLPASPAFVPLLHELAARLSGGQRLGAFFACGEATTFQLPPTVGALADLRAVGPDGTSAGELVAEGAGIVWRGPREARPGVYRIVREKQTVYAVAAVTPAEECDLRPIPRELLQERLVGGRRIHVRSGAGDERGIDFWWTWLAVACLTCLIGEAAVLRCFQV